MSAMAKLVRGGFLTLALVATASAAGTWEQSAVDADTAGGGALQGGEFTLFTTIAAAGAADPMRGGEFEATGGLERRRDSARGDAVFSDGFEP